MEEAQAARRKEGVNSSPSQVKEKAPAPVPPPRGPRITHPPHRQPEYHPQAVQHVEI